jgi:peptidoglycan hydrolase-like protein with peptidoglycan-binding domain
MSILKRGMKGAPVKRLQEALKIAADGDFGPGTEAAVKAYQTDNALAVDGIAGPDTFSTMGLHELVLLRVGSRGQAVKKLQADLGAGADGIFGQGTKKAVEAFQAENGLVVDGIAGPNTLAKLPSFAAQITPEVIELSEVRADEEHFDGEPMPELKGSTVVKGEMTDAPKKSLWGKVKGWIS